MISDLGFGISDLETSGVNLQFAILNFQFLIRFKIFTRPGGTNSLRIGAHPPLAYLFFFRSTTCDNC